MLYVNDNCVQLTRGDTARLKISVINDIAGDAYEITNTDRIVLSIKKKVSDDHPLIQKTIVGSDTFHILPSDTKNLSFGKYVYDIELTTESGDVYTVIEPTVFELLKEVTC